jgi:oligopeptide transport system ATP-binding protein
MLTRVRADQLVKVYRSRRGRTDTIALRGVSLQLAEGECLGVVGESGCGKSTLARLLVGLETITSGLVEIDGRPLTGRTSRRQLARTVQLVFQDPFSSLNPRLTVARALGEVLAVHGLAPSRRDAGRRIAELLDMVALDSRFAGRLPHEMSGGQAQRVAIARALAAQPQILILDEPTSALDVSVRAEVINLLNRLRADLGLSYLFITHDMAVIPHVADRLAVMYQGRIAESGPVDEVLGAVAHPYTHTLLDAVPAPDPSGHLLDEETVPPPRARPAHGCAFYPRCPLGQDRCVQIRPELAEIRPGHLVSCHFPATVASPSGATTPQGITRGRTTRDG